MSEISRQKQRAVDVHRAEVQSRTTGARQDIIFVLATLACLILTGLNVTGTMPFTTSIEAKPEAEVELMAYQTVNFAVREIDAYRSQHGRLPETLIEVGAPVDSRWTYEVLSTDRYRIQFDGDGFPVAYDSSGDADEFFAEVRRY